MSFVSRAEQERLDRDLDMRYLIQAKMMSSNTIIPQAERDTHRHSFSTKAFHIDHDLSSLRQKKTADCDDGGFLLDKIFHTRVDDFQMQWEEMTDFRRQLTTAT